MECIAEASDIVKQPFWIAAHCLHIVLSIITIVLSVKYVLTLKNSTLLNISTVLLISLFTALADVHAVVLMGVMLYDLYNSAVHTESCDLSIKTSVCAIPNFVLLACVVGMIICQNALWIDRLAATIYPKLHHRHCKRLGAALSVTVTCLAIIIPAAILHDDPHNDFVTSCVFAPAGSVSEVIRLFNAFLVLNLTAVTANIILCVINRRKEKRLRYNVTKRFQAFENVLVTKWVGMIVFVQFVFLMTYSVTMLLIRTRGQNMRESTKQVLRICFYVIPFSTVSLPMIGLLALRRIARNRTNSITRMTSEKTDQNSHMKNLRKMWNR